MVKNEAARVAAIDVGTNSVRLVLGHMEHGIFIREHKYVCTTRIGEGTSSTDVLLEEPMRRTAAAVGEFAAQAKREGYALLGAYATSAVREAPNRDTFAALCAQAGVSLDILSGHAESAIGFYGAAQGKPGTCIVADIGGGSTELCVGTAGRLAFGDSARVGAVRMRERFADAQGCLDDASRAKLFQYAQDMLRPIARQLGPYDTLIGVGGTFTTLCAMQQQLTVYDPQRVEGATLQAAQIAQFAKTLCQMPLSKRLQLPGLSPRRADIIAAAAVIAEAVMSVTGASNLQVSERDGLEGYAQAVYQNELAALCTHASQDC